MPLARGDDRHGFNHKYLPRQWLVRRKAVADGLAVEHAICYSLSILSVLAHAYRSAQGEVALLRRRSLLVRASTFNLNAFSLQVSLHLFLFLPTHIGELTVMLHDLVTSEHPRYAFIILECLCIELR